MSTLLTSSSDFCTSSFFSTQITLTPWSGLSRAIVSGVSSIPNSLMSFDVVSRSTAFQSQASRCCTSTTYKESITQKHPEKRRIRRVLRSVLLPQLPSCVQQHLRILQVSCIKPFGEPVVDRCQKVMGFLAFALLLPEASQAGGSTEFPGFCRLLLGYRNGVMEAGFGFEVII